MSKVSFETTKLELVANTIDEVIVPNSDNLTVEPPTAESAAIAATSGIALGRKLYEQGISSRSGIVILNGLSELWDKKGIDLLYSIRDIISFAANEAIQASNFKYVKTFPTEGVTA